MTTTTFVNGSTLTDAAWFNDADAIVYDIFGGVSTGKGALTSLGNQAAYAPWTTGGTNTAYTLTPTPASTANATGQRFRVSFNAASGATPTLAVSGQTAKNLKYYDSNGSKQAITSTQVPINWISDVEYDGTDWVVLNPVAAAAGITIATMQASTSGTTIDFTGIPATAKRITVMFNGVSTNGTSALLIQLGDAGGVEASGYASRCANGAGAETDSSAGIVITSTNFAASSVLSGAVTFDLMDAATFSWVAKGTVIDPGNDVFTCAGHKSTSAVTDRVRITATNGTDAFDAGAINISYE